MGKVGVSEPVDHNDGAVDWYRYELTYFTVPGDVEFPAVSALSGAGFDVQFASKTEGVGQAEVQAIEFSADALGSGNFEVTLGGGTVTLGTDATAVKGLLEAGAYSAVFDAPTFEVLEETDATAGTKTWYVAFTGGNVGPRPLMAVSTVTVQDSLAAAVEVTVSRAQASSIQGVLEDMPHAGGVTVTQLGAATEGDVACSDTSGNPSTAYPCLCDAAVCQNGESCDTSTCVAGTFAEEIGRASCRERV